MQRSHWFDTVKDVARLARQKQLWQPGDTVIIAVSGGPDSMMLMHLLREMNACYQEQPLRLIAAHVHHGFRAEESDQEAELVEVEASRLGIPFVMKRVNSPDYAQQMGLNPQAAARVLRYNFLKEAAQAYGATTIALAHHGDDQAETVLMHMIRGAGGAGLGGMAWSRSEGGLTYVRPLLELRKQDIVNLCEQQGITYAVDSSNLKRDYTRNRIRMDLLPILEEENPRIVTALNQMSTIMQAEQAWLQEETVQFFRQNARCWGLEMLVEGCNIRDEGTAAKRLTIQEWKQVSYKLQFPEGILMNRKIFCAAHVALQRRLIKLILNYLLPEEDLSVEFNTVERLRMQALVDEPTTWKADLSEHIQFRREYDDLLWVRAEHNESFFYGEGVMLSSLISVDQATERGELQLPGRLGRLSWEIVTAEELSHAGAPDRFTVLFDADQLKWPLRVRTRKPGDRMQLQGLKGSKKVQDMFVDCKVPPSLRDCIPMLEDQEGRLLWIAGIRRSIHALTSTHSTRVLRLTLHV